MLADMTFRPKGGFAHPSARYTLRLAPLSHIHKIISNCEQISIFHFRKLLFKKIVKFIAKLQYKGCLFDKILLSLPYTR